MFSGGQGRRLLEINASRWKSQNMIADVRRRDARRGELIHEDMRGLSLGRPQGRVELSGESSAVATTGPWAGYPCGVCGVEVDASRYARGAMQESQSCGSIGGLPLESPRRGPEPEPEPGIAAVGESTSLRDGALWLPVDCRA